MSGLHRLLAAAAVLLAAAAPARGDERILDFHSDIAVAADASMLVTETIRVRAEGDRIRHGIYRDFPTDYRDAGGNRVHVDFEPQALARDGAQEPYHTERQDNGVRVYFGSKDTTLAPGEYRYELRYRTTPVAARLVGELAAGGHREAAIELAEPVDGAAPGQMACLQKGINARNKPLRQRIVNVDASCSGGYV